MASMKLGEQRIETSAMSTALVAGKALGPKPARREAVPERGRKDLSKNQTYRSSAQDCRISSLKVLAMTLLKEIESLEKDHQGGSNLDLQTRVHQFEAELIWSALAITGGRQRRAAKILGLKANTLNDKIRRHALGARLATLRSEFPEMAENGD